MQKYILHQPYFSLFLPHTSVYRHFSVIILLSILQDLDVLA
ncbi:hypothetical protein BN1221_03480 [Brenneria goodwinii]|uniref:Uncharacterized protein n=1 Tax=Brenneria goodwinii TaxID=1109412 RepID=A0A0G4JYI6_9GAMM|nr:hypothetical protein BN1221_03480 [Brenneria goodwinii]